MSYNITGKFPSTLGKGVLAESSGGALMYYVMVSPNDQASIPEIRGSICLIKKDGEMMTKNVQNLINILGGQWDGKDIAALESVDPTGIQVVAEYVDSVPKTRQDGNEVTYTEIKNIYPANSVGGLGLPDRVDAKSMSAKYGAKFRAVFGSAPKSAAKPSQPPTAATSKPAPPPAKAPMARKADASQASLASCWDAFYKKYNAEGMGDKAIQQKWLDDTSAAGIDQASATPEQWAAFTELFSADDPTPF